MKPLQTESARDQRSRADRSLLVGGITLIALGLSILFLNSWDNLFVRASVGLFWGTFLLILNGPAAVKTFRSLAKSHGNRRTSYELSNQR
jgi:hypothetical protein